METYACPECKHFVEHHDMFGCVLRHCQCKVEKAFLIEYLTIGGK